MNNIILNSQHGLHKSEKSVTITIYPLIYNIRWMVFYGKQLGMSCLKVTDWYRVISKPN